MGRVELWSKQYLACLNLSDKRPTLLYAHRCSLKYQDHLRGASVSSDLFGSSSCFFSEASSLFCDQKKNNRSPNNEQLGLQIKKPANAARQYIRLIVENFEKVAPQFLYEPALQSEFARLQSYMYSSLISYEAAILPKACSLVDATCSLKWLYFTLEIA